MRLSLAGSGLFEFEEKKSRFIGQCRPACGEGEARLFISEAAARHRKASHNVFAYSAGGAKRHSDDGEPKGTAGMPVFAVFERAGVCGYVCVVTRYFGGILLGSGGLARAYARAAKGALESAGARETAARALYEAGCGYAELDFVLRAAAREGADVLSVDYGEACAVRLLVDESRAGFLEKGMQGRGIRLRPGK